MICEAALPLPTGSRPMIWRHICARPATAVHRYACVHEHVRERPTCDEHAPQPGIVGCRACFELGHECPMTAELVDDSCYCTDGGAAPGHPYHGTARP